MPHEAKVSQSNSGNSGVEFAALPLQNCMCRYGKIGQLNRFRQSFCFRLGVTLSLREGANYNFLLQVHREIAPRASDSGSPGGPLFRL